jgi:O-methyltransferase
VCAEYHHAELIKQCCREVGGIAGDAAEIGVYRGESAKLICRLLPNSTVWLFDTFTGFPRSMMTLPLEKHWLGVQFSDTSVEAVKERLNGHGNYMLMPGVFPQSAESVAPRLRFIHVDCDLYLSTKAALDWCWPLLVPGGVILDDDYGNGSCAGAKRAVDEFCKAERLIPEVKLGRAILRRHT